MSGHTVNTFGALVVCCMLIVWIVIAYFMLDKCRRKLMRGLRRRRGPIYETLKINIG